MTSGVSRLASGVWQGATYPERLVSLFPDARRQTRFIDPYPNLDA
jgi:hypothetical protein